MCKKNKKHKCSNINGCILSNTKSISKAQSIKICENIVIKGSQNNRNASRIEKVNQKNIDSIKLDNITINLLIQTIIKYLIIQKVIGNKNVEHYINICMNNNLKTYKLISQKANYQYPTLEDYIIKSNDNIDQKINIIKNCLIKIFDILDKLYDEFQFHHCDPKCAQLFLFNNNNDLPICMLGDLDKVTFTINIGNKPYRIRLTKDKEKNTFRGVALSFANKFNILNDITSMRYKNFPRKSNLLEKITFISSACILLDDINKSKQLRDEMLELVLSKINSKNIFSNYYDKIIKLDKTIFNSNIKTRKSFVVALKHVDCKFLFYTLKHFFEYSDILYSNVYLEKKGNSNKYNIYIKKENNNGV